MIWEIASTVVVRGRWRWEECGWGDGVEDGCCWGSAARVHAGERLHVENHIHKR